MRFETGLFGVLVLAACGGDDNSLFAPRIDLPMGGPCMGVAVADFNGDGRPDIAAADFEGVMSVVLNTTETTASFSTRFDFEAETRPIAVAVGDFNADGRPDVAVVNRDSDTVSVFLNETPTSATSPTFSTATNFVTDRGPSSVAVGDVNGDGNPDLVIGNWNDGFLGEGTVSVLLNNTVANATTPSFSTRVDFPSGDVTNSVALGDINGDGTLDVVGANLTAFAVVLLNVTVRSAILPRGSELGDLARPSWHTEVSGPSTRRVES